MGVRLILLAVILRSDATKNLVAGEPPREK
jgi:hypothetical protein